MLQVEIVYLNLQHAKPIVLTGLVFRERCSRSGNRTSRRTRSVHTSPKEDLTGTSRWVQEIHTSDLGRGALGAVFLQVLACDSRSSFTFSWLVNTSSLKFTVNYKRDVRLNAERAEISRNVGWTSIGFNFSSRWPHKTLVWPSRRKIETETLSLNTKSAK